MLVLVIQLYFLGVCVSEVKSGNYPVKIFGCDIHSSITINGKVRIVIFYVMSALTV